MFTNIYHIGQILANQPTTNTVCICDFVPPVIANNAGVTQIPDRIRGYNLFKNITGVQNTDYPITVLPFEKYEQELNRMVGYIQNMGFSVRLVSSVKDMYNSFVSMSNDLHISGVISFEVSKLSISEVTIFDWVPIGGKTVQLDLLTYFGVFISTFPQACISYTAIKQMYNKYKQNIKANGAFVNDTGYVNNLLATTMDISEISMNIDIAISILRTSQGTGITTTMLRGIIDSDGTSMDLTPYYNYMMYWYHIRHDVALDMLKYATDIIDNVDIQRGASDLMRIAPVIVKPNGASSTSTIKGTLI